MKNKKLELMIAFAAVIAFVVISCVPNQNACSKDARRCPDGSLVGRFPPKCEFAECPKTEKITTQTMKPDLVILPQQRYQSLTVKQDQIILINMTSVSQSWHVDYASEILELLNSTINKDESMKVFLFKALSPGETDVRFTSFSGSEVPPMVFVFTIKVIHSLCPRDVKQCADGSYVVRVGPNCEFQNCPSNNGTIKETFEVCEIENPRFNGTKECQRIIAQKYPNKECTMEWGNVKWLPLGSCQNCTITCSA